MINMNDNIKLGPFFYFNKKLLFNALPMKECELRIDKLDNPYSHEELFESEYGNFFDYIDIPRGRVIYDLTNKCSIIYIDPCIKYQKIIEEIIKTFNIDNYVISGDLHYHCKKCSDEVWNS